MGPADADVVQASVVASGHGAGGVDDVAADAVVGIGVTVAGVALGRVAYAVAGVAWRGRDRWGRWWLQQAVKVSSRAWSWVRVAG